MKKLKKIMVTVLSVAAVLSLTACGSEKQKQKENETETIKELAAPASGTTFEGIGYSIVIPEKWEQMSMTGYEFVIYCTEEKGSEFTENMNVLREDLSAYGSMTLDDYTKAAMSQFEKTPGYTINSSEKRLVNGQPVLIIKSTVTQDGESYLCEQMAAVENKTAYVITYSGDADGGFSAAQADAEAIMASFKVTK